MYAISSVTAEVLKKWDGGHTPTGGA